MTGQSVLSNLLCQALGDRVYAHIVKAVTDGKDWYDNYNDEPIFFMDDVGGTEEQDLMLDFLSWRCLGV